MLFDVDVHLSFISTGIVFLATLATEHDESLITQLSSLVDCYVQTLCYHGNLFSKFSGCTSKGCRYSLRTLVYCDKLRVFLF